MRIFILFLYIFSYFNLLFSWERYYGREDCERGFMIKKTRDNNFIICGGRDMNVQQTSYIYLIKTDYSGNIIWERFNGDIKNYGTAFDFTKDDGLIIAGYGYINGFQKAVLARTDMEGQRLWEKFIGGDSQSNYGKSAFETDDDGFVLFCQLNNVPNIIKTDSLGNILWQKTYNQDYFFENAIKVDDRSYIICGMSYNSSSEDDVMLMKVDAEGYVIWEETYTAELDQKGFCLFKTSDNKIMVVGSNNKNSSIDDYYILKTDESGNKIWDRTWGGNDIDVLTSIKEMQDATFAITGFTKSSGAGLNDMYIARIDSAGNTLWEATYGRSMQEKGLWLEISDSNEIFAVGYTTSYGNGANDIYLVKVEENGFKYDSRIPPKKEMHLTTYPNPASNYLQISFFLEKKSFIGLSIYDILGRKIAELENGIRKQGRNFVNWNFKRDFPSLKNGIYYCRLIINKDYSRTIPITIIK
ncbi:MAG: T9SS type A sorting domain-containing protein [Candidatus Coatesbacteria bacterium]|nr:T9SS type A sorting domain-containing protein [Candidatus Coatesbacteria bacterium]